MIKNYSDFVDALQTAGFSMAGAADGIYAIAPWESGTNSTEDSPIKWHTEDPETDPWEWRMRVLRERWDIAYGKLFFKKSGYLTAEWYPYFLAARRGGISFEEAYASGTISHFAKRIYDVLAEDTMLPSHTIKRKAMFGKDDKAVFDKGLVELQMKMFITTYGDEQRTSRDGIEYGWPSLCLCTTEYFYGKDAFEKAAAISKEEAAGAIRAQVLKLNPAAEEKKITKFIFG